MSDADQEKAAAAVRALTFVEDGMTLGLGTGSTAAHFVRGLGARVRAESLQLTCVATSEATAALARSVGLEVLAPEAVEAIDLAVDGADEADAQLRLIKGGGGALLREKIIAQSAKRFLVIVDSAKQVRTLGRFPLPVEVTPFGVNFTARRVREALESSGCPRQEVGLRQARQGGPFVTDGGNWILDCQCQAVPDPDTLGAALKRLTGVVEHGLFIGLTAALITGQPGGGAEVLERQVLAH